MPELRGGLDRVRARVSHCTNSAPLRSEMGQKLLLPQCNSNDRFISDNGHYVADLPAGCCRQDSSRPPASTPCGGQAPSKGQQSIDDRGLAPRSSMASHLYSTPIAEPTLRQETPMGSGDGQLCETPCPAQALWAASSEGDHRSLAYAVSGGQALGSGGRDAGRLYEDRHSRPELRWFWSITIYVDPKLGITTNGRVATIEHAKEPWSGPEPCPRARRRPRDPDEIEFGRLVDQGIAGPLVHIFSDGA